MAHNRESVIQRVEESLRVGNSLGEACVQAGVDRTTLWRWCREESALKDQLSEAMAVRDGLVEDSLFASAIHGDVKQKGSVLKY